MLDVGGRMMMDVDDVDDEFDDDDHQCIVYIICFFVCCHTFQSYLHIFTHTNYLLSVICVAITIGILVQYHHHHHHHHRHRRCEYHYHDGHKDHGDKDGNLMEPS